MSKSSSQKIAIVTGGASGIGLAIARKFVAANIFTVIIGRDKAKLQAAKEEFKENCEVIGFDLNELTSIPVLIERLCKQYGRIDILVNNAGINMKKEFTEVSDEDFQRILLTNVSSIFTLSREVVKNMLVN